MEAKEVQSEIAEIAIVAKAHVEGDDLYVTFDVDEIPQAFNSEMLSNGFAVSRTYTTTSYGIGAVYKNITDF